MPASDRETPDLNRPELAERLGWISRYVVAVPGNARATAAVRLETLSLS
jgi:hypothetical protein